MRSSRSPMVTTSDKVSEWLWPALHRPKGPASKRAQIGPRRKTTMPESSKAHDWDANESARMILQRSQPSHHNAISPMSPGVKGKKRLPAKNDAVARLARGKRARVFYLMIRRPP